MKAPTLIFALLFSFLSFVQLEYVATHDKMTKLIYLDKGEPAIFNYDKFNELIELYAPDQSLISSFTIPYDYEGSGQYNLYHVSRRLFDCDSTNIEYLISRSDWDHTTQVYVKILRDNGEEIFSLENHTFWNGDGVSNIGEGIIQVEDGVLIRMFYGTSPGSNFNLNKIYKSCGTVPGPLANNESENNPVGLVEGDLVKSTFNLYPNPGSNLLNIEYKLPEGIKKGELLIYNTTGQLVHQRNVGSFMNSLIVDSSSWNSGRYEVVLMSSSRDVVTRSFIKVKN